MLKKKLAVTIASIAAASFILGTMLNLNLITTAKVDNDPKPVWPTYITGVNATALPDDWNVTVTNWPVSTSVSVWWYEYIIDTVVSSPLYYTNGFSQLHILMHASLDPTETATFWIYGALWNGTRNIFTAIDVAKITLDYDNNDAAITIPVPSDAFIFQAYSEYECMISLSFHLTWA